MSGIFLLSQTTMSKQQHNPMMKKADQFAHDVYCLTRKFPKEEMYGMISQLRRASLSVILNIIEGFARRENNEFRRFLYFSFGSLKESRYLISFAKDQKYITSEECEKIDALGDEVAKLVWTVIKKHC